MFPLVSGGQSWCRGCSAVLLRLSWALVPTAAVLGIAPQESHLRAWDASQGNSKVVQNSNFYISDSIKWLKILLFLSHFYDCFITCADYSVNVLRETPCAVWLISLSFRLSKASPLLVGLFGCPRLWLYLGSAGSLTPSSHSPPAPAHGGQQEVSSGERGHVPWSAVYLLTLPSWCWAS